MKTNTRILITIEGGNIQTILSTDPATEAVVIDYDGDSDESVLFSHWEPGTGVTQLTKQGLLKSIEDCDAKDEEKQANRFAMEVLFSQDAEPSKEMSNEETMHCECGNRMVKFRSEWICSTLTTKPCKYIHKTVPVMSNSSHSHINKAIGVMKAQAISNRVNNYDESYVDSRTAPMLTTVEMESVLRAVNMHEELVSALRNMLQYFPQRGVLIESREQKAIDKAQAVIDKIDSPEESH